MTRIVVAAIASALLTAAAAGGAGPSALTPAGEDAFAIDVAVDGRGGAVALWRAGNSYALATKAGAKTPWSVPRTLASGTGVWYTFDVAADADGNAVAAWLEGPCVDLRATCRRQIRAVTRAGRAGPWSAPVDLTTPAEDAFKHGGGGDGLEAGFDATGTATMVWMVGPAGPMVGYSGVEVVQAATWSPTRGWSGRVTISGEGQRPESPSVAVGASGLAVATWRSYVGATNDSAIYAAVRPAGETGFRPSDRISLPGQFAVDARVGVGRGRAVVLYRAGDAIHASTWSPSGGWTAPTLLATGAGRHQVAVDGRGVAIAVWTSHWEGYASRLAPDSTRWSAPVEVSASDVAAVAANDRGDVVFAGGPSAAGGPVYAYRYSSRTGRWESASRVGAMQRSTEDVQSSLYPAVAVGPAGDTLVAWTSYDGSAYRGFVRTPGASPMARVKPRVVGTPRVGSVLTCESGTWTGDKPIKANVKWYRKDRAVGTGARYKVRAADRGSSIFCYVLAENEFGFGGASSATVRIR